MRSIVTDRVAWSVGRSVTLVSPATTAERIQMPFRVRTRVGPGNYSARYLELDAVSHVFEQSEKVDGKYPACLPNIINSVYAIEIVLESRCLLAILFVGRKNRRLDVT